MKRKLGRLSGQYLATLREHLKLRGRASLGPARELGRQAVALGLETLDLVRIHENALGNLEADSSRDGVVRRAEVFFAEALSPIEMTHRAALHDGVRLSQLSRALGRRTADLAVSRQSLKQGIAQRKDMERALKKSVNHSRKLLKESRHLQSHLQSLTHQVLSAQEDKRKQISRELHDEIAQTLLGINVRLFTLKQEAGVNARGLKKDIVSTQRLVNKSVKSIKRFASEFGIHKRT